MSGFNKLVIVPHMTSSYTNNGNTSRVFVHEQHLGAWLSLDYKLKQKMQLFMQVFGSVSSVSQPE